MRHGFMKWREQELSIADVKLRRKRLERAMQAAGLDAFLIYTNHVRSAGVTYLTGFTPYWSDGLLLVEPGEAPLFSTALSKRVGNWIQATNPTSEVAHSPKPGRLVGERLAAADCKRLGVLELDRLPAGLAEEILTAADVEMVDGRDAFASVRQVPDKAELDLLQHAHALAMKALDAVDPQSKEAGQAVAALERTVRSAGAEECYVTVAPDVEGDVRLVRPIQAPLGRSFAVRVSLAYNGVWVRGTRTYSPDPEIQACVRNAEAALARIAPQLDPALPLAPQFSRLMPEAKLLHWRLEAPSGTLPLGEVASTEHDGGCKVPYGVLSAALSIDGTVILTGGPIGQDALA